MDLDFNQTFSSYENGFGDVHGEFWLGLEYIYAMTSNAKTELRIDLTPADGTTAYEVFPNFRLSAAPNYTLNIDRGNGTVGDNGYGLSWHNGYGFYTYDHDDSSSCARRLNGGLWYHSCSFVNLNGQYVTPGTVSSIDWEAGVIYYQFKDSRSMKTTQMMFRRV